MHHEDALKERLLPLSEQAEHGHGDALKTRSSYAVVVGLCVSLCVNILLVVALAAARSSDTFRDVSKYAALPRDVPREWDPYSPYGTGNTNETDRSILWEQLNASPGNVALDNAWADGMGLPRSQPFPWDPHKGLYLLNGHHSLHCMRKVRRAVTIAHHNGTQLDTYAHLVHCMDHLLQNILCDADDTPMYSTPSARKDAGAHQPRLCRSWARLDAWAARHSSCYRFLNETQGVASTFSRYVWCPRDSPEAATYRDFLALPSDWFEPPPAEIDSMPPYWEAFADDVFHFHELDDHT